MRNYDRGFLYMYGVGCSHWSRSTLRHRFICRGQYTHCRRQKEDIIRTILVKFFTIVLHVIEYNKRARLKINISYLLVLMPREIQTDLYLMSRMRMLNWARIYKYVGISITKPRKREFTNVKQSFEIFMKNFYSLYWSKSN